MTLHTGPGCTLSSNASKSATGRLISPLCPTTRTSNAGCAFSDPSSSSFGAGFNNAGGGVFAHLWNSAEISIWRFPRGSIPSDITSKNPNPSNWGPPVAFFPSSDLCDISSHFFDHSLVIDTTLCGDWAGAAFSGSGCSGTCQEAVANPANFKSELSGWIISTLTNYLL